MERSTDPSLVFPFSTVVLAYLRLASVMITEFPAVFSPFDNTSIFNILFYKTAEVINNIICCSNFETELRENIVRWFNEINQRCANNTFLCFGCFSCPAMIWSAYFFAKLWSKILEG
jgi:hypothetical protein